MTILTHQNDADDHFGASKRRGRRPRFRFRNGRWHRFSALEWSLPPFRCARMVVDIVLVRQNGRCHRLDALEWSPAAFWYVRMVVGIVLARQNGHRRRFGASGW